MQENKSLLRRFGFRQNWPLWVTIFTLISAIVVVRIAPDVFRPPVFYSDHQTKYNYSDLLSTYTATDWRVMILLVVFACLSLAVIVGFFRQRRRARFLASLLTVPASCYACFILGASVTFADQTYLEDTQRLDFNDHSYHLTYAHETTGGWDISYGHYYVFECSRDNTKCSVLVDSKDKEYIHVSSYGDEKRLSADLMIDSSENVLYVQFGDDKVRIAPPGGS